MPVRCGAMPMPVSYSMSVMSLPQMKTSKEISVPYPLTLELGSMDSHDVEYVAREEDSDKMKDSILKYTIPPKQTGASFIVSLQQANGSWLLNDQLAGVVSKSVKELKSCCPVSCDDAMMANIWATLVVIELLKKKYPSMLDELELVIMKAEQWLSKQVLPSGVNLTTMRESAIKTV